MASCCSEACSCLHAHLPACDGAPDNRDGRATLDTSDLFILSGYPYLMTSDGILRAWTVAAAAQPLPGVRGHRAQKALSSEPLLCCGDSIRGETCMLAACSHVCTP